MIFTTSGQNDNITEYYDLVHYNTLHIISKFKEMNLIKIVEMQNFRFRSGSTHLLLSFCYQNFVDAKISVLPFI